MSRWTRRGRAAAKKARLLSIGEISYLASVDRITRPDALREAERFLRATFPIADRRDEAIEMMMSDLRRYPTADWVQLFLELEVRLRAKDATLKICVDDLLRGELPTVADVLVRDDAIGFELDRHVEPHEEDAVHLAICRLLGRDPSTIGHTQEIDFGGDGVRGFGGQRGQA